MRLVEPVLPRNAEDMIQNVIVRQLLDDQHLPQRVPPREGNPILGTMRQVITAARDGKTMAPLQPLIERYTQANNDMAQVLGHMFLRYKNDQLVTWMETEEQLETFLQRCMRRGDLTPAEALVFLKLCKDEIGKNVKSLQEQLEKGVPQLDATAATTKMDYTYQITEREAMKGFEQTTPQGREIVRKLVLTARKKMK